jgi:hypothetical protein
MLFRDVEGTMEVLKEISKLEGGELAEFVEDRCSPILDNTIGKNSLFNEGVEFFQLTKIADEMEFGQHEASYLLMLDLMFVDPDFQTYIAVKFADVRIERLVELASKL